MKRRLALPAALAILLLASCQKNQNASEMDATKAALHAAEQELASLRNAGTSKDQVIIRLQNEVIHVRQRNTALETTRIRAADHISRRLGTPHLKADAELTKELEPLQSILNDQNINRHLHTRTGGLAKHVEGLKNLLEIHTLYEHPLSYYQSLKVKDPNITFDETASADAYLAKSELMTEMIHLHYLCHLHSKQGYYITPEDTPLLALAMSNFPGLREIPNEKGHYHTGHIADFMHDFELKHHKPNPEGK